MTSNYPRIQIVHIWINRDRPLALKLHELQRIVQDFPSMSVGVSNNFGACTVTQLQTRFAGIILDQTRNNWPSRIDPKLPCLLINDTKLSWTSRLDDIHDFNWTHVKVNYPLQSLRSTIWMWNTGIVRKMSISQFLQE